MELEYPWICVWWKLFHIFTCLTLRSLYYCVTCTEFNVNKDIYIYKGNFQHAWNAFTVNCNYTTSPHHIVRLIFSCTLACAIVFLKWIFILTFKKSMDHSRLIISDFCTTWEKVCLQLIISCKTVALLWGGGGRGMDILKNYRGNLLFTAQFPPAHDWGLVFLCSYFATSKF